MPLNPGDTFTLKIDSVAFGGDGVGRRDGCVVFVPFAAAGDEAEVRVREAKKNFARAEIVRLVVPGPHRTAAPCPVYGTCGGCQYQHLDYAEELRLKEGQAGEALRRFGKIAAPPVEAIVASPQAYGYRNRITVHAGHGQIGFHKAGSREIVDVAHCPLAAAEVNAALTDLRRKHPAEGHFSLREPELPPTAFHQVNRFLLEPLRDLVSGFVGEAPAERRLVEGYCGGGFFTGLLAARFEKVWAVENDGRALRDARRLPCGNVEWIEGRVEDRLEPALAAAAAEGPMLALLDPPREGLPAEAAAALLKHRPARIVYVSCDPATLGRDAARLAEAYAPVRVRPVDLFPRTAQIETVSEWRLKDA